jgi:hypothetical protein
MSQLIKLARGLVKKGDAFLQQHGARNFHQAAAELLNQVDLPGAYDYSELIQAAFASSFDRIGQNFSALEFSDLPLTLARGQQCFIDIYFWRRRPTVIHNHHFSGAFQCLLGTNVDLEFTFAQQRKLGRFHALGEISVKQQHLIRPGDIQSIAPMNKFIHQNHHHSDLTINICFRTSELKQGHLSNYLYSGLRFEKHPLLLQRTHRLFKMAQLQAVNFKQLQLSLDDAIYFLLQTEGMESQHPSLLELKGLLERKVKRECGLEIANLLKLHEIALEKIQDEYN